MEKHHSASSSFHFKPSGQNGLIQVLNESSYLMAEYDERTGSVRWLRVVPATQKAMIEKWLGEHYPEKRPAAPAPAPEPVRKGSRTSHRKPGKKKPS
jgi:hypothetical protein